jgi:hypothetical protein
MSDVAYIYWDTQQRRVAYAESFPRDEGKLYLEQLYLWHTPKDERAVRVERRCAELQALVDNPGNLLRRILEIEERLQRQEER